jgi:hypothetical protein
MDVQTQDVLCQPPCIRQIFFYALNAKEPSPFSHAHVPVVSDHVGN